MFPTLAAPCQAGSGRRSLPMALVYWQPGTPSAVAPDTVAVVPTKMPQVEEPLLYPVLVIVADQYEPLPPVVIAMTFFPLTEKFTELEPRVLLYEPAYRVESA